MDDTEAPSKTKATATSKASKKLQLDSVNVGGKNYYDIKHDVYGRGRGYHG